MGDDDLIAALNQAVRQEVLENYLRERRVIEEEGNILFETCSAFHGGLSSWERRKAILARALLTPKGVADFFALAGLKQPDETPDPGEILFEQPKGLTRCRRHAKLVKGLYQGLWSHHQELAAERGRALKLREEINQDILRFERNHDMLALGAYLRSLEPQELQRRKILGVNFSASETAASAAALSFRPFSVERLGLDAPLEDMRPPEEALPAAQGLLSALCRQNPELVDGLWM
jgi:hypothetical protein